MSVEVQANERIDDVGGHHRILVLEGHIEQCCVAKFFLSLNAVPELEDRIVETAFAAQNPSPRCSGR